MLEKAVREVCMDIHQPAMIAVDLGCFSGQNTLFFVSKVIKVVGRDSDEKSRCNPVELQFFLNDLPGNDFSHVFRSLERFKESITAKHKENTLLPPLHRWVTRLLLHQAFPSPELSPLSVVIQPPLALSGSCWIRGRRKTIPKRGKHLHC